MADYTKNLRLIKPGKLENYNVDVANTNNEIIDQAFGEKQDKVAGKGLSTNDFTDAYKQKLDRLENYDDTDVKERIERHNSPIRKSNRSRGRHNRHTRRTNRTERKHNRE